MRFCEREKWRESGEELCTPIRLENKQTKKKKHIESSPESNWTRLVEGKISHNCVNTAHTTAPTLLRPLHQHYFLRCDNIVTSRDTKKLLQRIIAAYFLPYVVGAAGSA